MSQGWTVVKAATSHPVLSGVVIRGNNSKYPYQSMETNTSLGAWSAVAVIYEHEICNVQACYDGLGET